MMADIPALLQGPYGTGEQVEIPVQANTAETVCHWLVTAPEYHPAWEQYVLSVVRLTDGLEGFPEPVHKFEGTTHEMMVLALNPEHGPFDIDKITGYFKTGRMPYLTPINICEQFIATDDEMRQLSFYAVHGIVNGVISPEAPMSAETHRRDWLTAMTKTLAHIRNEFHAS